MIENSGPSPVQVPATPCSLHEGSNFLNRVEVNHASHVYTMGLLYGRISTWRTEQLVNSSRRYVSATPVRRLLSHELVKTTIL